MTDPASAPRISVVVPVKNEAPNVLPLVEEIERACTPLGAFELIYVDDGSTDDTADVVLKARQTRPWLRLVKHEASCGQSAAVRTGVHAARGGIIVTLDGDGQNDPAFIPKLVAPLDDPATGLVAGQRVGRKGAAKRWQSRIANGVRGRVLKDGTRDTGCGLKAFRRDIYLRLPYFDALHRFMPALVKREGYAIAHVDVVDRHRHAGQSKYGLFDRLWVGILDLAGVWWLIRRRRRVPVAQEIL
ncbi:glycosyltransferase family 2 protein [Microvirga sp. 17 mud 1-3]|uniref:glycosyltransferase family 2 protein n=1 Tax=Microvirga sp. 17 mud 1-3 TaxID=2082949 RepID=UPI000D6C822D|nr:glycosyltransferase family 2 protein [Microvirga sp. 17 mud 1-3]AWM87328.1 dolichol-phosphate mannosyltransferase [Microvirga sp. 17 mud 1-3]